MFELSFATGEATTDFSEAVGSAKLAKEHGYELTPARESFGGVIGTMLPHGLFELETGKQLKQLREDARKSRHGWTSLIDRLFRQNQSNPSEGPPCTFHFLPS